MKRALVLLVLVSCAQEPAIDRQKVKLERIASVQRDLLTAMEAEKSAVLARSEPEAARLIEAWKAADATVEAGRLELRRLVEVDARPPERAALERFDEAWSALTRLDDALLALTAENSNARASSLVRTRGASSVQALVDGLVAAAATQPAPDARRSLGAAVAALRIQSVLPTHVASADEAEMTDLEQRITSDEAVVETALAPAVAPAVREAWARYRATVTEVLALSRKNTHVKASALSLSEKREAMRAALNALAALEAATRDVPRATR